ncbi:MAG: phosphatase PAP2 family protein [Planctomycetaceae bacterium]
MTASRRLIARCAAWLGGRDLLLLLAVLAVVVGVWVFLGLVHLVATGQTQDLDRWLMQSLRNADNQASPLGPRWVEEVGRDFSALGGFAVLTLIVVTAAGYLVIVQKRHAALLVVVASLGGLVVMQMLKTLIDRPRPEIVPHLARVTTASFPSGHAMLSAVVYLTLGALLARFVPQRRLKTYLLAVALFLTFLVGASRVFLGVHYPSDVLAGWTAGLVWAVLCWLATRFLQRRGAVEHAGAQR